MFRKLFGRQSAIVFGWFVGAIALVAFTTPAYAGCKECLFNPMATCVPTAPGAGGCWVCVPQGSWCDLNTICHPMLAESFDVDGVLLAGTREVVEAILATANQEEATGTLQDFLQSALEPPAIRNCKGLIIAGEQPGPVPSTLDSFSL